jgi:hypothetical protein
MKEGFPAAILLGLLLLATGCAALPRISPVQEGRATELARSCDALFPEGEWRLVHTIRATLQGDRQTVMTGVTLLDPADRRIHSVMMTLEGLVVLDAVWADGDLTLNRGVPPFDAESFVRGMMADIRLIFFRPEGPPEAVGIAGAGLPACRYDTGSDRTRIITLHPETDGWTLRQYRGRRLARTVTARPGDPSGVGPAAPIAERLTLTAHGSPRPYTLDLTLLKGEPITDETP